MDSSELTEWIAFYQIEPFGAETQYIGHAITASTVANSNRGKGKKAAKMQDFMPKFERQKQQTVEQQIQAAAAITAAMGGTVRTGNDG